MLLHPGLNISDVDRAKIITVIEDLKRQIADLIFDLKRVDEFNLAAWTEHGDEIAEHQKTIDLLGEFLAGHISLSEEVDLRISDNLCVVLIREYEGRRAEIKARLEKISLIKSFLE